MKTLTKPKVIGFQAQAAIIQKLDKVAASQGISRSDVLRIIVNKHFQGSFIDQVSL